MAAAASATGRVARMASPRHRPGTAIVREEGADRVPAGKPST